ncbi:MAG TPA: hypothetical protein VK961_22390, partial [Chthoniobacter sp.]|nr:hypothetical protein [Chthoniobacter sp.]
MPEFRFKARSKGGQLLDGEVTAADRKGVMLQLERQGAVPIHIQAIVTLDRAQGEKTPPLVAAKSTAFGAKPNGSSVVKTSWSARALGRGEDAKKIAAADAGAVTSRDRLSFGQQHLFTEQLAHLLGAGLTLDESL